MHPMSKKLRRTILLDSLSPNDCYDQFVYITMNNNNNNKTKQNQHSNSLALRS